VGVHYCVLFSSRIRVRIRLGLDIVSGWFGCYEHVFVLLPVVIVTLPR